MKVKPEMMTPKIIAPSTVPMIEPRPPDSDTPPMTAMAMASSSYMTPMPACAVRFLRATAPARATEASMPAIV